MPENFWWVFQNFVFFSDILVNIHHGNFLKFLRMGEFSDIFSLPKQKNLEYLKKILKFFWRITRKGAVETVYQIMDILQDKIIVFTILFIVPVLRLMSDRDQSTRQLAAQTFGKLIQLMPLGGISNDFWLAIT